MISHLSVWQNGEASASKKSEILDIALALRERAPWSIARRILERVGLEAGHGWEAALDEIRFRDNFDAISLDELYYLYFQHVCCGEKSTRLFKLGDSNAEVLRLNLKENFKLNRLKRPRILSSLAKAHVEPPQLECAFHDSNASVGVFSSIRRFEERVPIQTNDIPQAAQGVFAGFDEIIAIRAVMYQAYGVIWLPDNSDLAEVRIDIMRDETVNAVGQFHQQMYAELHSRSGSSSIISPVNLFGAIKSIYNDQTEGNLMELSFATTTGSVKQERMRSHESLRQETYHVGGIEALSTEIEPFHIGVRWRRQEPGVKTVTAPELYLHGNLSQIGTPNAQLHTASVKKVATYSDFDFVRDKLLEHA